MTHPKLRTILAIFILIILTLIFFWKILLTNLILVGVDTFLYFYPYKAYAAEAMRQGRLPLWNPHLFMGVPLLANSQVGLFYPLNWPFIWLDAPKQVAWSIGWHVALAGILMFTFTRRSLRLSWVGALVAAVLFAFGGYLGAQVEHINQLNAAIWLPLLFLLYDLALAEPHRRWFWLLWLAVVVAITLLAGHTQTVFISLFGLGLYALWQVIAQSLTLSVLRSPFSTLRFSLFAPRFPLFALASSLLRHLWPLVVVSVLALALAAIQLVPTAELSALSVRSGGLTFREVVSFSLRPTVLHFALLPPLGIDLSQILGQAFSEWVAYVGVSSLVLALLGALQAVWQQPARRFVFIAGSGLILSLGMFSGPLYLALYYLVPGFNLFRVPARWLLLYAFGAAVLAGYGFDGLVTPATLRHQLSSTWQWLCALWWRVACFIGLPLIALLGLIIWKTPPPATLLIWLVLTAIAFGLVTYRVLRMPSVSRNTQYATRNPVRFVDRSRLILVILPVLVVAELFWASQSLNYNHPTAPQAYHSLRNAIAFLLAADSPTAKPGPPGRFLSLSGITYDPGDLRELEQIYGDRLSAKALYNLVVATKEKEVLFFNLPLVYGLHSVDGYDGGILPLNQFVILQQLFLPTNDLSLDGRLREKLRFVPPARLLSLLNTRWIITDKQFDVWIDDIFYDLQFPAHLFPGQTITTTDIPIFPATAIGLVTHLEGASHLPTGTPVAELTVTFTDDTLQRFVLKAGQDSAEGHYPGAGAGHPQPKIGVTWPYEAQGVDYITVFSLPDPQQIDRLSLKAALPEGLFVLRGLSLINQPTVTSRSVILSTEGNYRQVHSGDVKIYENLEVLPRAFLVHQAEVVTDEAAAIAAIRSPEFDPAEKLVRLTYGDEHLGGIFGGQPSPYDRATISSYEPERVEIAATLDSPGWLVLTDTYYPGWQATIDGRPTEIFQANLMFRAVAVPAGSHTVVFEFKPRSVQIGALISALAAVLLIIGLIVAAKR